MNIIYALLSPLFFVLLILGILGSLIKGIFLGLLMIPCFLCQKILERIDRREISLEEAYAKVRSNSWMGVYKKIKILATNGHLTKTWVDVLNCSIDLAKSIESSPTDEILEKANSLVSSIKFQSLSTAKMMTRPVLDIYSALYIHEKHGTDAQKEVWVAGVEFNTHRLRVLDAEVIPKNYLPQTAYLNYPFGKGCTTYKIHFDGPYPHQDILDKIEAERIEKEREAERRRREAEEAAERKRREAEEKAERIRLEKEEKARRRMRFEQLERVLNEDLKISGSLKVFGMSPYCLNKRSLEFRKGAMQEMLEAGRAYELPTKEKLASAESCLSQLLLEYSEFFPADSDCYIN